MSPDPVLHVLAGPNGSGKSTFVERVLAPETHLPFVNADVIARERWPGEEAEHGYEDSRDAATARSALLAERRSFLTETVFSHPSKLELLREARAAGYRVTLHVVVVPVELCVARVGHRVEQGGHHVPEDKVRERYARLWSYVHDAVHLADEALVYDNSTAKQAFRLVAAFYAGRVVGAPDWPTWTPALLRDSAAGTRA